MKCAVTVTRNTVESLTKCALSAITKAELMVIALKSEVSISTFGARTTDLAAMRRSRKRLEIVMSSRPKIHLVPSLLFALVAMSVVAYAALAVLVVMSTGSFIAHLTAWALGPLSWIVAFSLVVGWSTLALVPMLYVVLFRRFVNGAS
jgi:hypothetical protein